MDPTSKDNVQTTIKNLEDKIQYIEKLLEKGQDCLIFQYGSSSIKFNRANESAPKKIQNHIAYRVNKPIKPKVYPVDNLDQALNECEHLVNEVKTLSYKGKPRGKVEVDLHWMGKQSRESIKDCCFAGDIESRRILFEDDVYAVDGSPDYEIRQPIQYGFFSHPNAAEDLYWLTMYCIQVKLGIQSVDQFSVILIIPDVFQRNQVKSMVDMLLRQCGFKQIYIHLESVLACFGVNQQTACIVDIGSHKINICCVEEGVIIPGSYLRKNFGSTDIDFILQRLIQKKHAILRKGFRLEPSLSDLQQMSVLKERIIQMVPKDDRSNYLYDMHTIRDQKEEKFQVAHTDSLFLATQLLFEPILGNSINKPCPEELDFTSRMFEMYYDPEDNLEELSGGIQLSWFWGSKEKENQYQNKEEIYSMLNPSIMQSLDLMICYALASVLDAELRPKFAANILLIGGGANLIDLQETLQQKIEKRSADFDLDVEKFEVRVPYRDELRPQNISWVGASILPKTESMNEMWITRLRWIGDLEPQKDEIEEVIQQCQAEEKDLKALEKKVMQFAKREREKERSAEWGIKHLKEKIPFVW